MKRSIARVAAIAAVGMAASGCSTFAVDRYAVNADNVAELRELDGVKVNVGEFQAKEKSHQRIMCRAAGPVATPDGSTFAEYIGAAFTDELKMAEAYDPEAPVTLVGTLNEVGYSSAGGMWNLDLTVESSNGGTIAVTENYDYESSFNAISACNGTARAFVPAVQNLVGQVISDPDFEELVTQ